MLRQIKVRYDALEDRLQLTLQTDPQTHHLLLTRRVWTRARVAFQRLLDLSAETPASLPRSVRESISAAHHQAVAAQTPAAREPVEVPGAPADAALVTEMRLGQRKGAAGAETQRSWVIEFGLHQRPEVRLVLNDRTLHALVGALLQREETAQWALPALPARSALAPDERTTLQ
jgi:hypothetical protein